MTTHRARLALLPAAAVAVGLPVGTQTAAAVTPEHVKTSVTHRRRAGRLGHPAGRV